MDYKILFPESASVVEFKLNSGESVYAESDAMICMDPSVSIDGKLNGSFFGALFRSVVSDESIMLQKMTARRNNSLLLIGHKDIGGIESVELDGNVGLVIQKGGYLAHTGQIELSSKSQGLSRGVFGGEGLFLLHAEGKGIVFVSSYGAIYSKYLERGEELIVDNGHLVAWSDTISYEVEKAGNGWISALTSGECLVCHFRGPGVLLLQTRNIDMLADSVRKVAMR